MDPISSNNEEHMPPLLVEAATTDKESTRQMEMMIQWLFYNYCPMLPSPPLLRSRGVQIGCHVKEEPSSPPHTHLCYGKEVASP